jgi:hypothetical protein
MAQHERRYKANLGDVGEAVNVSSETWHDNPAFDEPQQQARAAYTKLKQLQAIRDQATIISEKPSGDTVEIGCRVRYTRATFAVMMRSSWGVISSWTETMTKSLRNPPSACSC